MKAGETIIGLGILFVFYFAWKHITNRSVIAHATSSSGAPNISVAAAKSTPASIQSTVNLVTAQIQDATTLQTPVQTTTLPQPIITPVPKLNALLVQTKATPSNDPQIAQALIAQGYVVILTNGTDAKTVTDLNAANALLGQGYSISKDFSGNIQTAPATNPSRTFTMSPSALVTTSINA